MEIPTLWCITCAFCFSLWRGSENE